jgi:hypothetical protein
VSEHPYYGTVRVLDINEPRQVDDEMREAARELLEEMEAGDDPFADEGVGFCWAPYIPVHKTPDFLMDEDNMHVLNGMTIDAKKDEVLAKLKSNRSRHAEVVAEAREGYVAEARKAVEARLKLLASGKVVALTFSLKPPQDHTNVYDTAIQMLELHTGDEIELTNEQVRTLVMDEWDWSRAFWASNKGYSKAATEYADERGW